jgi:hypothetical protein
MERDFHVMECMAVVEPELMDFADEDKLRQMLEFMTGQDLAKIPLMRAADACRPSILVLHPEFRSPETRALLDKLVALDRDFLDTPEPEGLASSIRYWFRSKIYRYRFLTVLDNLKSRIGQTLPVRKIPNPTGEPLVRRRSQAEINHAASEIMEALGVEYRKNFILD